MGVTEMFEALLVLVPVVLPRLLWGRAQQQRLSALVSGGRIPGPA